MNTQYSSTGIKLFDYTYVFSNICPQCKRECVGNKEFIAVAAPYYCLMHNQCAVHYQYNNLWPHQLPQICYEKN